MSQFVSTALFTRLPDGHLTADGATLYVGLTRAEARCLWTGRTLPVGSEAYVTAHDGDDTVCLLPWAGGDLLADLACLDADVTDECQGPSEPRMPLSGTGVAYARCERHWGERLDRQDEINRRYPTHAPADWSPLDAGEAWGEDDY